MRTVVWIASYPKSGNTWLRFLVCNLIFGPIDSAAALNRLVPDIHEMQGVVTPPERRTLMKTHFVFSAAAPLAEHTAAAIYIVRDPADVLVSNFHYAQRSGATVGEAAAEFARYVDAFLGGRGDPRWLKAGMGSWDEHVRAWTLPRHEFPVLTVRYEDLLFDGMGMAKRICRFLGVTRTASQIEQAVVGASFERMKTIEIADIQAQRVGIFYKPYLQKAIDSGLRFMRHGRSGEGVAALTADQRQRLDAAFGGLRHELGYGSL
jgi:aryl sulfotransferase